MINRARNAIESLVQEMSISGAPSMARVTRPSCQARPCMGRRITYKSTPWLLINYHPQSLTQSVLGSPWKPRHPSHSFLRLSLCPAASCSFTCFSLPAQIRMANLLGFMVLSVLVMGMAVVTVSGRSMTDHILMGMGTGTGTGMMNGAKIAAICSTGSLVCTGTESMSTAAEESAAAAGILRDMSIHTINDFQKDFFLESALVGGGKMSLDQNLRDPAPKRAFLASSAAKSLPRLTEPTAKDVLKHFGVAPHTEMAKAVSTAAFLCGSGALPGEAMHCAASAEDMANFISAELGPHVKVLSTSGTAAVAPAVQAPVTIIDAAKGSVAEGERIVVCHHVDFPSELYYCHRVTGTKVVQAALEPQRNGSNVIKAVGICHIDTSLWLSTHPAFAALNIPRGDEACHWLVDSDLVFVPVAAADRVQ